VPGTRNDLPYGLVSKFGGEWSGGDGVVGEFVFSRGAIAEGGVPPLAVVEDLHVVEDRVGEFDPGFHRRRLSSSICIEDQKLSIMALSRPSPTLPKDVMRPAERILSLKAHEVNWTP
jgi:hypothetical protein